MGKLKRYDIYGIVEYDTAVLDIEENKNGEFVYYEDIEPLIKCLREVKGYFDLVDYSEMLEEILGE